VRSRRPTCRYESVQKFAARVRQVSRTIASCTAQAGRSRRYFCQPAPTLADLEAALRDTSVERLEHNVHFFSPDGPSTCGADAGRFIAVNGLRSNSQSWRRAGVMLATGILSFPFALIRRDVAIVKRNCAARTCERAVEQPPVTAAVAMPPD